MSDVIGNITDDNSEAMMELLGALNQAIMDSCGKNLQETVYLINYFQWHLAAVAKPPAGRDVLLQYRTKSGDLRMMISKWTGKFWTGKAYHPQVWMPLPDFFYPPEKPEAEE